MIIIARIRQIIDGLLNYVQSDYEALPEEQTFLYQMFMARRIETLIFMRKQKSCFCDVIQALANYARCWNTRWIKAIFRVL